MRSFTSHLSNLRNNNLVYHTFVEMARRGVDPNKFVDWYASEGILLSESQLTIQSVDWLKTELLLSEGIGSWLGRQAGGAVNAGEYTTRKIGDAAQAVGDQGRSFAGAASDAYKAARPHAYPPGDPQAQPADPAQAAGNPAPVAPTGPEQAASQAVSNLSGVLSRVKNHPLAQDGNFMNILQNLLGVLRSMPPAQAPAPQGQPAPGAAAPGAAASDVLDHALHQIAANGVDPMLFAEWYIKEGYYLSEEDFQEGFSDWWGKLKSKASGWWNGGSPSMAGWKKGGEDYDTNQVAQAIQAVNQAIQGLQGDPRFNDPGVQQSIQKVVKAMNAKGGAAPQAQPVQPQANPGGAAAPTPQGAPPQAAPTPQATPQAAPAQYGGGGGRFPGTWNPNPPPPSGDNYNYASENRKRKGEVLSEADFYASLLGKSKKKKDEKSSWFN